MPQTGHEDFAQRYRQRKAAGKPGWTEARDYERKAANLQALLARPYMPSSGRALELGCGAGNLTIWLTEQGFSGYGLDIVPEAIAWAREEIAARGLHCDVRVGDVVTLADYDDSFFDFVLDGDCLHCIVEARRGDCLRNVHRVLRPGGVFRATATCASQAVTGRYEIAPECYYDPASRCVMRGGAVAYFLVPSAEDFLQELRQAGFRIADWTFTPSEQPDSPYVSGSVTTDAIRP